MNEREREMLFWDECVRIAAQSKSATAAIGDGVTTTSATDIVGFADACLEARRKAFPKANLQDIANALPRGSVDQIHGDTLGDA